MTVKIETAGPRLLVSSPYMPAFVAGAKQLRGKWDPEYKVWSFDARDEAEVRDLCRRVYGTDGASVPECVDVEIVVADSPDPDDPAITFESQTFSACGRVIASRPYRDSDVRLGEGVRVIEGAFARSGGSGKYPSIWSRSINSRQRVKLLVRDVPQPLADELAAKHPGAVTVRESGPTVAQRIAALTDERNALVARLEQINEALAALGGVGCQQ
jgi:hypothetical protein